MQSLMDLVNYWNITPQTMSKLINPKGKILIVKPSSMGDVIHSLPVLEAIHRTYPEMEVHWVIAKGLEGLLRGHPMISRLIAINKDDWKRLNRVVQTGREIVELLGRLKDGQYDTVIDLQGLLRSGIITAATGAPVKIGFSDGREGSSIFYTHTVKGGRDIHAVERYLKIAALIGCSIGEIKFPMSKFKPAEDIVNLVGHLKQYLAVVPGARWQTKRWPPERFAELITMTGLRTVLLGSAEDRRIGALIKGLCKDNVADMTGKTTLSDMVYILRHAQAVITNDTGPMHIAAALKRPLIAIFGPTNPVRTGPYGDDSVVITAQIDCAPCYKKSCQKPPCMNTISAHRVYGHYQALAASIIPP